MSAKLTVVFLLAIFAFGIVAAPRASAEEKKKVLFIAGNPTHGYAEHENYAGCVLLSKRINECGLPIESTVVKGWPADPHAFDGQAAIVIYCDGGGGHVIMKHLDEFNALVKKGVGVGCLHYGVEIPKGDGGNALLGAIGGYFEMNWSVNPHWTATFKELPKHPVASGVNPLTTNDEWYYHMRFVSDMAGVTPILSAVPPDATRQGKDGTHSGNPDVRAGVGKNIAEHVLWVYQRPDNGGRGFGCSGGHFHRNWAQDDYRKAILNAIVWSTGLEVPADGVKSTRPDAEELLANITKTKPEKFDMVAELKKVEETNAKK